MFYRICFLRTKMRQQLVLAASGVATSPCWMEANLVTNGAGSKTSVKNLPGGCSLLWAELQTQFPLVSLKKELYSTQVQGTEALVNLDLNFQEFGPNRWVLVKTKSGFEPKAAKLSPFEHLSRIQVWWGGRNSVLVDKFLLNPKVKMKS